MKLCRKLPALMAVAVALSCLGIAGCGNSGEGQIKVDPNVRKRMSDDDAAPKKDGETPTKASEGSAKNIKTRLGKNAEN